MRKTSLLWAMMLLFASQPCWAAHESSAPENSGRSSLEEVIRFNGTITNLDIFTNWNQTLAVGEFKSRATVLGVPRTVIRASESDVCLYSGTLVVESGATPFRVRLKEAEILLAPGTTTVIAYHPLKSITIQAFGLKSNILTRINCGSIRDARFKLRANEQLEADIQNNRVQLNRFSLGAPASRPLPSSISLATGGHAENSKIPGKALGPMDILEQLADSSNASEDAILIERSNRTAPLKLSGSSGTEIAPSEFGQIRLISGRLFTHSESGDVIHTELGDVQLQRNSLACIERWQGQMRLASYSSPHAVSYKGPKGILSLQWGQELVVTDHAPNWGDVLPDDGVARRNFQSVEVSDRSATLSDFQIGSALRVLPQLAFVRKPATKEAWRLQQQMLKTAVAVEMVTGSQGRFITSADLIQLASSTH